MKFKLFVAAAFISLTLLISCAGNKDKDYVDKSLISPSAENKTVQPAVPNTATTQATNAFPNTTTPGAITIAPGTNTVNPQNKTVTVNSQNNAINVNPQTVANPSPVTTNTQQVTAPGMNPPHGQPGHRCDISVGAPLNSKPAPTNTAPTTVTTTQPSPVTINTQETQQVTAPGMNPPHGQPNHRCDIAVGAPLNSPPAQTPTPPQTITIPAKKDSVKN